MITRREYASNVARSSIELVLTLRPSFPAAAPAVVLTWPKAPKRTFRSERPIASLISLVSRLTDGPTSVPATRRAELFIENTLAETAGHVQWFMHAIPAGMLGW